MNAPPPHSSDAGSACCPQCWRSGAEAEERAARRARWMEQMALLQRQAGELCAGFLAQARGEMAAAEVARTLGEPGTVAAEGTGSISMLGFERASRVMRRCMVLEARADEGTLGVAPAVRVRRPAAVDAVARAEGFARADALLRQGNARLEAIAHQLRGRLAAGAPDPAKGRLDPDVERLDAEAEDALDDEGDDGFEEDSEDAPADAFMSDLCRVFSSEREMAQYSAHSLALMRRYLPEDWKPGDPVPPREPTAGEREEAAAKARAAAEAEAQAQARAQLTGQAADQATAQATAQAVDQAADQGRAAARPAVEAAVRAAVAEVFAPAPAPAAGPAVGPVSRGAAGPRREWAFADRAERALPAGAVRPPWKPPR